MHFKNFDHIKAPEMVTRQLAQIKQKEKYIPGFVDKKELEKQAFPEHHKDFKEIPCHMIPPLKNRKYFPQGVAAYDGALQITKATEIIPDC